MRAAQWVAWHLPGQAAFYIERGVLPRQGETIEVDGVLHKVDSIQWSIHTRVFSGSSADTRMDVYARVFVVRIA